MPSRISGPDGESYLRDATPTTLRFSPHTLGRERYELAEDIRNLISEAYNRMRDGEQHFAHHRARPASLRLLPCHPENTENPVNEGSNSIQRDTQLIQARHVPALFSPIPAATKSFRTCKIGIKSHKKVPLFFLCAIFAPLRALDNN